LVDLKIPLDSDPNINVFDSASSLLTIIELDFELTLFGPTDSQLKFKALSCAFVLVKANKVNAANKTFDFII
jgi:hypothetical protein